MTIAKTIMDTACTVAGEDVSAKYGPLITDALDALTDALAGENVSQGATIEEEFAILAPYIENGGGGGGDTAEFVIIVTDIDYDGLDAIPGTVTINGDAVEMTKHTATVGEKTPVGPVG